MTYDFHLSTAYGFVFASKELKRDRFCEADTHCKFKRVLKPNVAQWTFAVTL